MSVAVVDVVGSRARRGGGGGIKGDGDGSGANSSSVGTGISGSAGANVDNENATMWCALSLNTNYIRLNYTVSFITFKIDDPRILELICLYL